VNALLFALIAQVHCGEYVGTAFHIGGDHWVSASHITVQRRCKIGNYSLKVTERDAVQDFLRFDTHGPTEALKVSCEGFVAGRTYYAVGYQVDDPRLTRIPLTTSPKPAMYGRAILEGPNPIEGMSGGPILNDRDEVVGTIIGYINGTNYNVSVPLKNTSLCRGATTLARS
jgi:hypothetical protein